HTRFSRDWSSDVCSSDLFARRVRRSILDRASHTEAREGAPEMNNGQKGLLFLAGGLVAGFALATFMQPDGEDWSSPAGASLEEQIGTAAWRERERSLVVS